MTPKNQSALQMLTTVSASGSSSSLAAFVHSNPGLAADLSRLVSPRTPATYDNRGNRTISRPNSSDLKQISSRVAQADEDATAVMQLFSDVKIACEILISSIRSPNDMYEGEVLFELKDHLHVSPLASKLLPLVSSYFRDVYPLADKFEDILRGTLFGAGSYPILVIPENSLTDLISGRSNISTEAYAQSMSGVCGVHTDGALVPTGIMGANNVAVTTTGKPVTALERATGMFHRGAIAGDRHLSLEVDGHKITSEHVIFLDNPIQMQMPITAKLAREKAINDVRTRMGGPNATKMTDRDLTTLLYRESTGRQSDFVKLKTDKELKRYSVGRPLVLDLPPESVVPVINRGRPKDPIGFIVLLDSDGAPLSRMTEVSQFEALKKSSKNAQASGNGGYGDMSSYLLQKTAQAFGLQNCEEVTLRQVHKIYGEILEADFGARMRNGIWGKEVTVSNSERLAELMLYRLLSGQQTQVLFVPEEMLTYFNYQVNDNGTGRNLLQDSLVISSMRAQVLFARVMGAVKNSIGRTQISVEMDPDEPDSQATYDLIKSEVVAARQTLTTPNSVNPTDVLNQIQAAGLEFSVTGAKGLPETKVVMTETSTAYVRPDEDLQRELADLMINHIGVPPEMIEEARRPDFATVAIANNVLFSKRVRHMQSRYDPQNTHLVISMLMADSTFVIELKKVIQENLKIITDGKELHEDLQKYKDNEVALIDLLTSEFISNLRCTLARPDIKSIENNLEALAKHEEMTEKALEYIFSSSAVDAGLVGEQAAARIDALKAAAKAAEMRRFMLENNMAVHVFDLVTADEEGLLSRDLRSEIKAHSAAVAKVMVDITVDVARVAAATDVEMSKAIPTSTEDTGGAGFGDTSSSGPTSGGDDSLDLGGFPMS